MTVSRPRASRLAATKCKTSNASFVTVWSFSSSLTIPRQASDERISVGRKYLRANMLLPEPLGPTRTTRLSLGILIVMSWLHFPSLYARPRENSAVIHELEPVRFGEGGRFALVGEEANDPLWYGAGPPCVPGQD